MPKLMTIMSNSRAQWTPSEGDFETKYKAEAQMLFIELHETRSLPCEAHIAPDIGAYDMIVGREKMS
jgi:hypothetical protein